MALFALLAFAFCFGWTARGASLEGGFWARVARLVHRRPS